MKAIVYTEYGPPEVLHLQEVPQPVPADDEILVRVRSASVNFGDLIARRFSQVSPGEFSMPFLFWVISRLAFGFSRPKVAVLGSEFAGEVAVAGKQVTRYRPGDAVFGYRAQKMGTYAEYVCMSENGLVSRKPDTVSFEQAAALPYGALTALALLRTVNIQPGQRVLVNGASGSIGSAAVQLARYLGAEVTGVCATPRMEYVRALGADRVIDYTCADFTQNGQTYDVIFDILGKSSFTRCKNSLTPDGRYLLASFKMKQLFQMLWTRFTGGRKVVCALSSEKPEDMKTITGLIEAGQLISIVDRCYPLEQAAQAHRYVESDRARGKVVLTSGRSVG